MMRPGVRAMLFGGLSLAAGSAHAAATLEAAELATDGTNRAALMLTLSSVVKPKLFMLDGPDRIVVDLPDTQRRSGLRLPEAAGPVLNVRSGAQAGALRLVLETRGAARAVKTRVLRSASGGYRVSIDLGDGVVTAAVAAAATASPAMPVERAAATRVASAELPMPATAVRSARTGSSARDIIVAVDAGHGGQDPGAIGRSGTREKDVVLGIATALARRIDAEPGMRAVLTRGGDRFIPLRDRMDLARSGRADLFVSVHADSIANREVSGSSVYVLSNRGASSEAARWLAERENAADLKGGVSLGDKQGQLASVLMDLSQTASIGSSMEAAQKVLRYMDRVGDVRKSEVQQAGFVVLKSPDIPSMLVETAYISNPAEERKLRTSAHQEKIAEAIFSGVRDYFRASPPDGTLFAEARTRDGAAAIMAVNAGR